MTIELSNTETENIVNKISDKLIKNFLNKTISETIYTDASKMVQRLFEIHNPSEITKLEAIDLFKPIVKNVLKENNLLQDLLKTLIREHFDTKEFKKLSINMLQDKINQIEYELEQEFDTDSHM